MKTTDSRIEPLALLKTAVLSALLAAPWLFPKVADLLTPEDFGRRENREIHSALVAMHGRGLPPDFPLLVCELVDRGKASVVESARGLLQAGGVVPQHLPFYCEALVQRRGARRKALEMLASSNTSIGEEARSAPPE